MVKKATKRKTRWRTLSIGDGGADTSDTGTTEIKQEQSECLTSTSNTSLSTYNRKSSLHTTPFHQRNGDRNHYYRNSDKYPSQSHTRTQSHEENLHRNTSYPYRRRPFYQSSASRYYGNINNRINPSTNNRTYRSPDTLENKENNTTKPLFNEDDYTRISTPRQDVLFKKGYLSRPKKTITPTETTVSTTVSVVSTEDSGTQSLSPEHCSSTPEIFDPDQPLMYPGFYDENGVFFFSPFMPNGFDPYDDQFIMMPYDGSPFSINPSEYCNGDSTAAKPQKLYQKRNSVDSENSPESPSSQNESASSTPAIDDTSNEPSQNDETPTESQSESDGPKVMEGEITPNECNHNMPMQFYYPFMYGPPPFSPIDEYNGNMAQYGNSYGVKYNRFKKRKRRPFKYGNSTGVSATTTDYSEDEDSIEENNHLAGLAVQSNNVEGNPGLTIAQCDEIISRTNLNTNVSEFVPRHLQSSPQTTLNVEVEEFHPRNYTPIDQPKPAVDALDASPNDTMTKKMSSESRKVTILPRNTTETTTHQPTASKTSKDDAKQLEVQVSPAIDKSSTLISSISSRDKTDDNVNGVDNNKKIETQVDPVNIKADLDVKAVMHPKQQENILENVKKTKFKSTKSNKSSPRKQTNGGPKKDGKIGKSAITNGKRENVPVATNEPPLPVEPKANEVEDRKMIIEKSNQPPTYAQMLGPVPKPKTNIAKKEVLVGPIQENVKPVSVGGESKMVEVVDETKPVPKVETIWQTVRPKGKKKLFSALCEEPNDEWNDVEEEQPVQVKEINKITETPVDEPIPIVDETMTESSSVPAKVKPPKTEKVKLKVKPKKSQKKIKEKSIKSNAIEATPQPQNGTSTPKSDKMRSESVNQIMDDLFADGGHEFLDDIDISNFSFETSPTMFLNAITNSGIYTDNSLTGKSGAGFSLNNSLKLLNSFDFCKTKENVLLKEEEEMVIRVLQSLNQTDSQVVEDDVKRHVNVVDDVKSNNSCDDVETIFDVVNGHSGDDDDDDNSVKKMETIGAETLDVECEMNGNEDALNEDAKEMNGHRIEETSGNQEDEVDGEHPSDTNPEIEPVTNGNHLNGDENSGDEMDVNESKETNGYQIEDIGEVDLMLDIGLIETKPTVEPITNGHHLNGDLENGEEIDVSAQPIPTEIGMPIDEINDLDVTNVADKIETEQMEMVKQILVDENEDGVREDCNTNIKSDDETHSDLSELSDENDETVVSQSNDFEYDEIETIREIDVAEFVDDLQFDEDADGFAVGNDDEMNIRNEEKGLKPLEDIKIQESSGDNEPLPPPSSQNIFIENEAALSNTEITLNDIEDTKNQDRIQSPRNSEDSGILEYQDDGKYFSESDNDKTEQISVQNFPLTEAVSRWLEEKQKEKSPEPVIRLPDDPRLSERIEKSIMSRQHITQFYDDYEDETSEESDTEFELPTASKNLLSNPLRVLFRKRNDTANHSSNGIRKRVAKFNPESDKSALTVDEPDILEYWENDPMLQSQNANVLNNAQCGSNSTDTDLDAYESVYGKTIDYAKLSANIHNDDHVFLSNNILNNDKLSKLPINPINSDSDSSLPHASSISGKNDTNSIDKNLNCFKPPEICCMLM
ncbi:uncharacterized protein LOC119071054 isoform X2 [Bradysia coprophila]|uniref:uncharacterized protein LOC119071054 isoform X2 n=1 Tax=Bradysia coprophila TaxID=38358 RepID=UPI00187D78FD|nr:uncharacterized protein LOC119071054 isoform X2 [Bradysia coprophila]